jgi:hypothetical protein
MGQVSATIHNNESHKVLYMSKVDALCNALYVVLGLHPDFFCNNVINFVSMYTSSTVGNEHSYRA